MRSARAAACFGLACALTACNPTDDYRYFHEGIGTGLYWQGLPAATDVADAYFSYICRQAGISPSPEGGCPYGAMSAREWGIFVQAGFNDIDLRCDSYLAWLDDKKRSTTPILKQLSAVSTATQAILNASSVGPNAITIVGIAFGLAADTFLNVQSRLLQEIDHTTVQSVVLGNQQQFRLNNLNVVVDNRPAAVYLLRNYLRICMPFSIEMSINNTVTVFQRGGPEALRAPQLVTRSVVATSANSAAVRGVPLTSRETIVRQARLVPPSAAEYADIIKDYNPAIHTISKIEPILVKLCVPANELRAPGARAKALIQVYQDAVGNPVTGSLTTREITRLGNVRDCPADRRNYFEANLMPEGLNAADIIELVNAGLQPNRKLAANASVQEVRSRIPEVRAALSSRLQLQSPLLSDQFTSDLVKELTRQKVFQ